MLIDKNKNKIVTQAIPEAAATATASRIGRGGNITCAQVCQKHGKAVSVGAVTSASVLSQSTAESFPSKGDPMHFCEYCRPSSIALSCCCPCARCVQCSVFYIYTTALILFCLLN